MSHRFAVVNLALGHLVGVDGAIAGMAAASRKAGLPIDVIVLAADVVPHADIRCLPYRAWPRLQRWQRLFRYRAIASAPLDHYDVLFLRYPVSLDLDPLVLFRRRIADRIVTVHHSNELRELASTGGGLGTRARVLLEWAAGRRVLTRVDGIVGVTDEIRALEVARAGGHKTSAVISNGIDVDRVPFTRCKPFDGQTLRIVFVASAVAPWHGWDRLRGALRAYRGPVEIVVDAVGSFERDKATVERHERAEIRYHGVLRHDSLSDVLSNANLAVSSLAMHRAGLRQGCVLKTREYAARGLPFIYAYDDVDLHDDDPFSLRLAASDAPIDLGAVIDFAASIAKSSDLSDLERHTAKARMSWTAKMQLFDDFARRLMS